jgi:hypothetical protein
MFATECAARPEAETYLRTALIHHHPFTFETKNETLVQRVLARLGLNDETFLRLPSPALFGHDDEANVATHTKEEVVERVPEHQPTDDLCVDKAEEQCAWHVPRW